MDYISQINSVEHNFVYVIILALPVHSEPREKGENALEKIQKDPMETSGDGTLKLQISVPCRGRTCPDLRTPLQSTFRHLLRCQMMGEISVIFQEAVNPSF